jgi:hypothetical protein
MYSQLILPGGGMKEWSCIEVAFSSEPFYMLDRNGGEYGSLLKPTLVSCSELNRTSKADLKQINMEIL